MVGFDRNCVICDVVFTPTSSGNKTCSSNCSLLLRRQTKNRLQKGYNRRDNPLEERTCPGCGAKFISLRKEFCSRKCGEKYYWNTPEGKERKRLKDLRYSKSPKGRASSLRAMMKNFREHPEKVYARKKAGKLPKQPCELCGAVKAQAHHEDYFKPIDVRWLCATCHRKLHREGVVHEYLQPRN